MNYSPKVVAASMAGALSIILIWGMQLWLKKYNVIIPPEVASSITTVFSSVATLLAPHTPHPNGNNNIPHKP